MASNHPEHIGGALISTLDDLAAIREFLPRESATKAKNRDISLSLDGRYIAAGNEDCTACVWDVESGQEIHCFVAERQCFVTEFSPDGRTVLVGNQTLRLFDVESGAEIWCIEQGGFTCAAAFSACGRWLVTAPQGELRLWDVQTGEARQSFSGHTGLIVSVQFLPDGRHLIFDIRMWRLPETVWTQVAGNVLP